MHRKLLRVPGGRRGASKALSVKFLIKDCVKQHLASRVRLTAPLSTESTQQFYSTRNSCDKKCRWFVTDIISVCVRSAVARVSGVRTRVDSSRLSSHFDFGARSQSTQVTSPGL